MGLPEPEPRSTCSAPFTFKDLTVEPRHQQPDAGCREPRTCVSILSHCPETEAWASLQGAGGAGERLMADTCVLLRESGHFAFRTHRTWWPPLRGCFVLPTSGGGRPAAPASLCPLPELLSAPQQAPHHPNTPVLLHQKRRALKEDRGMGVWNPGQGKGEHWVGDGRCGGRGEGVEPTCSHLLPMFCPPRVRRCAMSPPLKSPLLVTWQPVPWACFFCLNFFRPAPARLETGCCPT